MAGMKRLLPLFAAFCLCVCPCAAWAEAGVSFADNARALPMPAAGLTISVPAELETVEGDEAAFDLGFRYNGFDAADAFDLVLWVHDARDLSLADYAAFYAERNGFATVTVEMLNGFPVGHLSNEDDPGRFSVLVADPNADLPEAVYTLSFSCTDEGAMTLAGEILSTLAEY
jgi:hypothetical protein